MSHAEHTFLFCDLVGFTALTDAEGDERAAAVAVDNVLHDEGVRSAQQALTRERDRLQLLLEVNNAVVSRLDLSEVFTSVIRCLQRLIPHDDSNLLLYEPETRRFRKHVPQATGTDNVVADCQADAQWARSPVGIAITTRRTARRSSTTKRSATPGTARGGPPASPVGRTISSPPAWHSTPTGTWS